MINRGKKLRNMEKLKILKKIRNKMSKLFLFILFLLFSTLSYCVFSQTFSFERNLLNTFIYKISIDNNTLPIVGEDIVVKSNTISINYNIDSNFVFVYQNKSDFNRLSVSDIHNPDYRLAIYVVSTGRLYFISGFKNLDLEEFFMYFKHLEHISLVVSEVLNVDFLETNRYFLALREVQRKQSKKINRIYKRYNLYKRNTFINSKVY